MIFDNRTFDRLDIPPETKILNARTAAYAALIADAEYRREERARLSADRAVGAMHNYVQRLLPTLVGMRDRLRIMESSKFWEARNRWFGLKKRLGLSKNGALSPFELQGPHPDFGRVEEAYDQWLRNNVLRDADIGRLRSVEPLLPYRPLISVIMPTYNTPPRYLRDAIDSVRNQIYTNWELCIADDASTDFRIRDILHEYEELDERIKVVFRAENGHISRASNSALGIARGEYIALLDHDDIIVP